MTVCPLCEHEQPGGEACEVCGRSLRSPAVPGAPPPDVAPLDGLEPTLLPAGTSPAIEAPALEGMEPTRLAAAAEEPPSAAAGAPIDVEPTGYARPPSSPRDPLAPKVCRYCRTAATPGEAFCERCGMRLAHPGRADR